MGGVSSTVFALLLFEFGFMARGLVAVPIRAAYYPRRRLQARTRDLNSCVAAHLRNDSFSRRRRSSSALDASVMNKALAPTTAARGSATSRRAAARPAA